MSSSHLDVAFEKRLKLLLRREISRLKNGMISPDDISDDVLLFDAGDLPGNSLALDSVAALEIAMSIEEECGVLLPEDIDFGQLRTLNRIVGYVRDLAEEGAAPLDHR